MVVERILISLLCPPTIPTVAIPANLMVGITGTMATVTWSAATNALTYEIRYRVTGTSSWTTVTVSSGLTGTVSGLTVGSTYDFQVRGRGEGDNYGEYTSTVQATVPRPPLPVPGGLTLTSAGTFMEVTFSAASMVASYQVRYRRVGTSTLVTRAVGSDRVLGITGLTIGQNYEAQVRSVTSDGSLRPDY